MTAALADASEPEFEALLRYVEESRGLDLRACTGGNLRQCLLRRMSVAGADGFGAYHALLEVNPQECVGLLDAVLGGVTPYRDAAAWDALRRGVPPRLPALGGDPNRPLRIWSAGCGGGEEPYALAMLLAEAMGAGATDPDALCRRVRIYATDRDEAALRSARRATYALPEVAGVPPALLGRYFERAGDGYRVVHALRRAVVLGRHDVARNAPVGGIDLLVCRNLLAYLDAAAAEQVVARLHGALAGDGLILLGAAETRLTRCRLFVPVDPPGRLYRRAAPATPPRHLPDAVADAVPLACLAVERDGRLAFANAAARQLLGVAEGDLDRPVRDLPALAEPAALRGAIEEAARTGSAVRLEQRHHRQPAGPVCLAVEAAPLPGREGRPAAVLVTLADCTRLAALGAELAAVRASLDTTVAALQGANEALEATNEELRRANEALEAENEALRSAAEALEAAGEEMRVRQEGAAASRRLAEGVLRGLGAGLVVLDAGLRVRAWDRWSEEAWGLRAAEAEGRDLSSLAAGLAAPELRAELLRVLAAEVPRAELVLAVPGRCGRAMPCRLRVAPLPAEDGTIEGAVLIFEEAGR